MVENESNRLVKGALLLTFAGLISKILSAGYRIPLQNLTGDIGFYIYQQVYPILGMVMILSLYGFPSAISKMIVDLDEHGKKPSLTGFYLPIFLILLVINGMIFLFLLFNAELVANWVGDANLIHSYQTAAFAFLLVPFTSLLRGVFQGNYYMKPTAFSQVGEQLIRVFIIIAAAIAISMGVMDLYSIGQFAAIASIAGGVVAVLILGFYFVKNRPFSSAHTEIPIHYFVKQIVVLGMVAALNHMTLLVIQFADAFTLIPSLVEYGLTQIEAMEAKGIFDRGQPLIQIGTVLGSSFALALIPSISKQKLEADPTTFYQYIRSGLLFSFYLAVGATIGLIAIFPETNRLLFENTDGTSDLQILVLSIFLCSIAITASSVLQGLGFIKRTAGFVLGAFFVKWIANQLLVPWWGITGSAIATVLSLLVLFILVMFELKRKLPDLNFFRQIKWRALFAGTISMIVYLLVMKYCLLGLSGNVTSRLYLLGYVLFVAGTGACIFLVCLLRGGAFSEEQLKMLPFASILIRIQRGRKKYE
ncbi:low temperature requirement protein B [Oceanobacillus arenosus]|uniref:Low temperature requirement protein B n=1 Tax=Oceanobacillus arenosus TaxID=1229153 RepID=A0A3D8PJ95_9BACI|nr:polysaccharide biosynthesis protein [Oceanobacillus arenosus]RDW15309.1 low temperature requirement protein B [Oceanobacillus arenosus]